MKIEFTEEILKYCYEENKEYEGFLTSCEEILIPYILKNHKKSLKEYIHLDGIALINDFRTVEINVFDIDRDTKINVGTFKNIEKELIRPLYHSLKGLNLKYLLKISGYLYLGNGDISKFACCWKEFRISNYDYQVRVICPSLNVY